ncbi:hypothetical protein K440DRAFT_641988 [Wilcoxina mikolae CBS 423.85]|nr:hypothetical protein K440DRAFT_641988 [Wilcoxina mikolae CBS 423.85]
MQGLKRSARLAAVQVLSSLCHPGHTQVEIGQGFEPLLPGNNSQAGETVIQICNSRPKSHGHLAIIRQTSGRIRGSSRRSEDAAHVSGNHVFVTMGVCLAAINATPAGETAKMRREMF